MTKKCCTCKKTKDVSEFSLRSKKWSKHRHKNGLYAAQCKQCHREYVKKHYYDNQTLYYQRALSYRKKLREKLFFFFKDKQCVECGENDPIVLDFDHLDSSKKKSGVYQLIQRGNRWENIMKEIEKCQILCANCHRRKSAKQFGYTRYTLQNNETQSRRGSNKS